MINKNYSLAGLIFAVQSDVEIKDDEAFRPFYTTESEADYCISVRKGKIEEFEELITPLYEDENCRMYESFNVIYVYTYLENKVYACFEKNRRSNKITVTVDYPGTLSDSLLFRAINLRDILLEKEIFLFYSHYAITGENKAVYFIGENSACEALLAERWMGYRAVFGGNKRCSALGMKNGVLTAFGLPLGEDSDSALNDGLSVKEIVFLPRVIKATHCKIDRIEALVTLLDEMPVSEKDVFLNHMSFQTVMKILNHSRKYMLPDCVDENAVEKLNSLFMD